MPGRGGRSPAVPACPATSNGRCRSTTSTPRLDCRCRACGYVRDGLADLRAGAAALARTRLSGEHPVELRPRWPGPVPRTDALDVIVELLGRARQGDSRSSGGAASTTASARRSAAWRRWSAPGCCSTTTPASSSCRSAATASSRTCSPSVYGTLEETPIAQVALSEDRVVEVDRRPRALGARALRALRAASTTLTCTPVSAGGRWLGVIFADRGGGHFELSDERAPRDVDARQDRGAGRERAHRDEPAGPRAAACRRASTSRATSTSAWCSGCSASRSCSARSTR